MGSPECSTCQYCGEVQRWDYMLGVDECFQYCDSCIDNVAFECEECGEFYHFEDEKNCPENPNKRICINCFHEHLDTNCKSCGYRTCSICGAEDLVSEEFTICKDKVICTECNKEHIKECVDCSNKRILILEKELEEAHKDIKNKDRLIKSVTEGIEKISKKLDNN